MDRKKERQINSEIELDKKMDRVRLITIVFKVIVTLLLCALFVWFITDKNLSLDKDGHYVTAKVIKIAVLSALSVLFVWIPYPFKEKHKISICLLLFTAFVAGILNFICMETISGDLTKIRHLVGLLNLVIIYFLMMSIYALTNRIKPAIIAPSVFLFVFTMSNYFAKQFRGIPILASDILLLRTVFSVAGEFNYVISFDGLFYLEILLLIFIILSRIPEKVRLPKKPRIGYLCGYIVVLGVFLYACVFSNTLEKLNVKVHHFAPNRSYISNGSLLTFIRSFQMVSLKTPEGYSVAKVEDVAEKYIKEYEADNATYRTPNVIVVMNEAFADLQAINGAFETNVDVMPVIHSLSENTIKGTAYSSVYGGYTANSEYEFLTGHSTAFVHGVVPFQFLIKNPMSSMTTYLSGEGYDGLLAIHPYNRNGYNRDTAYRYLGFSHFKAFDEMGDREHAYVRNRVSDADDVQEVIGEYEKIRSSSDAPVFIFNVTMQNHSPFDVVYDNFTADVKVLQEEYQTLELEQYLSLIKLSDASLGQLIDYFSEVDEDTVILFFGDHEPKLAGSFYNKMIGKKPSSEANMQKYEVPYVIWTNYDIEEKDYGDTSLNYLSSIMADSTGMKLYPYQRYLMELREEIPIITANGYWDKDHNFYETDSDSPYQDILDIYEYTQYNNLADGKHRIKNFFGE